MSELPGSFKAILTIIANLDFFFKIFLFIFGCAGSLLLHNFFFFLTSCGKWRLLCSSGVWASPLSNFSRFGAWALEHEGFRAVARKL